MERNDQARGNEFQQDGFELDLNRTLKRYSAVEPRTGLEQRVMARLRAEPERIAWTAWRQWGVAVAVAALVLVAMAVALRSRRPAPLAGRQPPVSIEIPRAPEKQVSVHEKNSAAPRSTRRATSRPRPRATVAAVAPKLDVFPSPQPLSEQERMLESFVQQYPRKAILTAEIRMEALREDAEERRAIATEDRDTR